MSADRRLQVSGKFLNSYSQTSCSRLHHGLLLQILWSVGFQALFFFPEFGNDVGLTGAPCLQLSLWGAQMKARSWLLLNETQLACLPSAGPRWRSAARWLHRQGGPLTSNNIHVVPKSQASSQLDQFPNLLRHTAKRHLCQQKARGIAGGGRKAEPHSWFCFF